MSEREAIRLVIWDLDETFWRGTITEGGMEEYVAAHHELVIELARRGIMSSICSKNDFAEVQAILTERGLWDYFIFPSIDWSPKPGRIAEIIDAVQLRPATVLFIDDNPSNRAAAAAHVPGLQVESEDFIPLMQASPLLKGKNDAALSRLAQYKLMEKRKADQISAGGDNSEFLRSSGIRVTIETDIADKIDRAVELINRTNQLNFTKNRLPDDADAAAAALAEEIRFFGAQSGLIRVTDKYGDYGYCGFYLIKWRRLIHYCFSCRILGFGVESWLYEQLKRPRIEIVGEVLTDLKAKITVDWINNDSASGDGGGAADAMWAARAVKIRGACESGILDHYFSFDTKNIKTEINQEQNHLILRGDSLWNLQNSFAAGREEIIDELCQLGFAKAKTASAFLAPGETDDQVLVLFCGADFRMNTYQHKAMGFRANFYLADFGGDLSKAPDEAILRHLEKFEDSAEVKQEILQKCRLIRADYVGVKEDAAEVVDDAQSALRQVLSHVPAGAKLFLITPHTVWRTKDGLRDNPQALRFNQTVDEVVTAFAQVIVVNIGDFVQDDSDIIDLVHYSRIVYFRLYKDIKRRLAETTQSEAPGEVRLLGVAAG